MVNFSSCAESARLDLGMTSQYLSFKTGIHYQTLRKYLRGKQEMLASDWFAICKVLYLDPVTGKSKII